LGRAEKIPFLTQKISPIKVTNPKPLNNDDDDDGTNVDDDESDAVVRGDVQYTRYHS